MTREDSIRTRTWVTEDGRYLTPEEMTSDHLHSIRRMLINDLPRGYDRTEGQRIAGDWLRRTANLSMSENTAELDRNAYDAAWIQILDDELLRRNS